MKNHPTIRTAVNTASVTAQAAVLLVFGLLALLPTLPSRIRRTATDERGESGGHGLIILIVTVIGVGVAIAVGVLIRNAIDNRSGGLNQ